MEKIKLKYKHEEMNGWGIKKFWYECDKTARHGKFHSGIENSRLLALKNFIKIIVDRGSEEDLKNILEELDLT